MHDHAEAAVSTAIRWLGEENCTEVFALLSWEHPDDELDHSVIYGLGPDGGREARPGDWIVPDGNGWFTAIPDADYRTAER